MTNFSEDEEFTVDWTKVQVDTKILVRDFDTEEWTRKYFAKYEDGIVYTWFDGRTSYTEDSVTPWRYAKLYDGEE